MTDADSALSTAVTVTVFYGPSVSDRRDELAAGLDSLSDISVAALEPLAALEAADDDSPALVVSDSRPATLPDRSIVWATTDPAVATAVADDATVVNWGLDDDWAMLAARLTAALPDGGTASRTHSRHAAASALKRVGDAVLALDTEFRLTYLNDAAAEFLDVSPADVRGDSVWEYLPDPVVADLRPHVERSLSAGEQVTVPLELDDQTTLLEVTAYPGPDGVTLRSQAHDDSSTPSLYEYLVETVGDAVYILDSEGRFVFVNDALCEMTGYERDELLGSSVHIIKDDETVERAEAALRDLLKGRGGGASTPAGIDIAKLDVELVRKDGTRVPCTDRMTLRPLEDGDFTGTVGTLRDVSRQHRRMDILNGLVERSRAMMTASGTEAVTEVVVSTAVDVFGLDLVALRKYDPDVDGLVPVATSDSLEETLGDRPVYDVGEGPAGTAFQEGELVVREDLSANPDASVTGVDHGVYLPIGDRYVLSLGQRSDDGFDSITLGLLEVFGETAAAAIDRVDREEHLQQYEAIVEAAEDMLFTVDDDGRFTLVTRPFAAMLGTAREELVGRPIADFLPDEAAAEALSAESRYVLETELHGDAGTIPCRLTLAPFESPFGTGLVGTVRDISQLKSAQREASRQRQRFVELFETLSDPVADVSYRDGVARLENINAAFADLCERDAETLQRGTFAAARDAMPDELAAALDPVESPPPSLDTTVRTQTPAGERQYLVRTAPYESGGTDRAFVLLTDVTELSRRGTQLKVLHRLLRHNLRNETALIKGHAEQLRRLSLPAEADSHIEKILDASDELVSASETSQTVQQVLGFDADDIDPVPATQALEQLQADITGSLTAPDTDVTVTADTDRPVPFSQYLLIALRELVANAIEHDPASEVVVRATADQAGIHIQVSDDGEGLPEQQWDLLTGDREITQLQHGDGLGLWLVKWVTNRHGGQLRLPEAGADGTTIALVFPTPR
ncbi:PAS domain-containing protein [Salinibaculum rarum]|uniref:PAS domain-containing protein n=1 Tax=Salinibaculum rarum TaxID=3058903 RepID=UPI00265D7B59|nr:PAS domain-containing protein [Salinibaculum sp. KK48]